MRLARGSHAGRTWLARLEGDAAVLLHEESEHPAADALREALALRADLTAAGPTVSSSEFRLLSPVANPSKIVAIGLNYADHAREVGAQPPAEPLVFAKA